MADVLRTALVGVGVIGSNHIAGIEANDNVRLAAVMDVDAARAQEAAAEHDARAYTDLAALLADDEVDAVHICTPHALHDEQVLASLGAGKHVLVEKPMSLTPQGCDAMLAAQAAAGKVLMVGQVMRYFRINKRIKELIAQGAIGTVGHMARRRLFYFSAATSGIWYRPWYLDAEQGGSCLLHAFGPHEYDILHWYLDSPVVEVYARGSQSTKAYSGQPDSFTALMTHECGAVSTLTQSLVSHTGGNDTHIIGSEGSIALAGTTLTLNGEPVEVQDPVATGMRDQIGEFADCCLTGREPDASGRSVRHTMAVIEAARLSSERGEAVQVAELD